MALLYGLDFGTRPNDSSRKLLPTLVKSFSLYPLIAIFSHPEEKPAETVFSKFSEKVLKTTRISMIDTKNKKGACKMLRKNNSGVSNAWRTEIRGNEEFSGFFLPFVT